MSGTRGFKHTERAIVVTGFVTNASQIHRRDPHSRIFLADARIRVEQRSKKCFRFRRLTFVKQDVA